MTRKHFKIIAAVLKKNGASPELINDMAAVLWHTNPAFDADKFFKAATKE